MPQFLINLFSVFPFLNGIKNDCFLINEEFCYKTNVKERVIKHEKDFRDAKSSKSYHLFSLNSGLLQYVLEIVDKSSGASSLEARYPFFDKRLIEFCLALPIEQKINNGWSRIIMRRAMENILPKEIQWRTDKSRLGSNFRKNFLSFEQNLIEEAIFNKNELIQDYVNINSMKKIYNQYKSHENVSVLSIFGVVTIYLWIRNTFK